MYIDDYGSFAGCSTAVDEYLSEMYAGQPGGPPRLRRIMERFVAAGARPAHHENSTLWRFEAVWFVKPPSSRLGLVKPTSPLRTTHV